MGFFGRKRDRERELLQTLLEAETKRIEAAAETERQKIALDRHKMELDYEHLEAASEQRRKDREAAEELRTKRRQWAAEARLKKKQQPALPGMQGDADVASCPACKNPGDPRLTAEEIKFHHRHLAAAANRR
jgi:hypothetical protein